MSVRRAQEEIDEDEFRNWMAYNKLSPISDERGDYQAALVSSVIVNSNRQTNSRRYNVDDFMPRWEPKAQMSEEEICNVLKGIAKNGRTRRT
jgi:hypothetical protein